VYSIHIFQQISSLHFSSLKSLEKSVIDDIFNVLDPVEKYEWQYGSIEYALTEMQYNEYFFYIFPDSEAVLQSKMEYQEGLKALSSKLNFQDFENPDDGVRFLTAFYEHYLKIIEWNNNSLNNIIINEQFYNNYSTFCVFLNKIIPIFFLLCQLFSFFYLLSKVVKNFFF
jgi:hypothetical protein